MARGESPIVLVTDALARYQTSRNLELNVLLEAEAYPRTRVGSFPAMERLRPMKVLWRLTGREFMPRISGHGVMVDGNFRPRSYAPCAPNIHAQPLAPGGRRSHRRAGSRPRDGVQNSLAPAA